MGYIKPKKKVKRLESRIRHFKTDKHIQSTIARYPGSFTQPGSLNKS